MASADVRTRGSVAGCAHLPVAALIAGAADADSSVRSAAAAHRSCPWWLSGLLCDDPEPQVRVAAASSDHRSAAELDWSAGDSHPDVVSAALSNPRCGRDTLDRFMRHDAAYEHSGIAGNPFCEPQRLQQMANPRMDSSDAVLTAVAVHQVCPPQVLDRLARDWRKSVRSAVAANPNCGEEMLRRLARDTETEVRAAAATNPACPADALDSLARFLESSVRSAAAANPSCWRRTLRRLASDSNFSVRQAIAGNPICDAATMATLSRDEEPVLRFLVAGNSGCPRDVLVGLARDDDVFVRRGAVLALSGRSRPGG